MFQNKVVVITGGANGIVQCIAEEFKSQGEGLHHRYRARRSFCGGSGGQGYAGGLCPVRDPGAWACGCAGKQRRWSYQP